MAELKIEILDKAEKVARALAARDATALRRAGASEPKVRPWELHKQREG